MCGLAGAFRLPGIDLAAALERISHRGPDASGIVDDGGVQHGHVRLAVQDLSPRSDQPFRLNGGVLSYNGELWNAAGLRAALAHHTFTTTGDTEVLAAALDHWGMPAALDHLEGMFAFAWSKDGTAWLARDRFGKIPLYVHRKADGFAWASERKAFPGLWMRPLAPGSALDLTSGSLAHWYALDQIFPSGKIWDADSVGALLDAGVERRLVSDAPLCCLLSGGLDSSLIAMLAQRRKPDLVAFTAVMDGHPSSDLVAASRIAAALEIRLEVVKVRAPDIAALDAAAFAIETSSKAQVEIATLCIPLAAAIRANGFKVVLSGEAADELFGGYGSMVIKGYRADDAGWRDIRLGQIRKMAKGNFVRCNKVFMAHGVECRLPFMDRALVETVVNLPKAECPPGKGLLKDHAIRLGLDAKIAKRVKQTFQGAAGTDLAAAKAVANPVIYYRNVIRRHFGDSAV